MEQPNLITQLTALAHTLEPSHPQAPALLRWAILHIESQNEALEEARQEWASEEAERLRLEQAAYIAQEAIETALAAIKYGQRPPAPEIGRDMVGHINIMAGHGDPDYLNKSGNSIRHVDLREKPPRKKKANALSSAAAEGGRLRRTVRPEGQKGAPSIDDGRGPRKSTAPRKRRGPSKTIATGA